LASPVLSTPVVSNGALWVDTTDPATLYKLNPSTGATECSLVLAGPGESSLTAATPPGGQPSIFIGELDQSNRSGPIMAVAASTCQTEWSFNSYRTVAVPWAPIAYGVDATGEPLVLAGTADPDQTEYALDAVTGKLVWSFQTAGIGDYDIAAGATISPPGANGFADGVAYVISKYGIIYALDLTTGAELWSYTFEPYGQSGDMSTAALEGTDLVFGDSSGVVDLNAVTGALQ
jgi:outer membrane protein assembly factor BamB